MTCSICVLRVPEFDAIARELAKLGGVSLAERGDYLIAEAHGEIALERSATGVGQAVWFGALTGGMSGTVLEFSAELLRVAP